MGLLPASPLAHCASARLPSFGRKVAATSHGGLPWHHAEPLRLLPRFFNSDHDGFLSFDEFNAALVRMNFVGQQDTVRRLFDRYDTDGSGFLAYEEFTAGLFGLVPNLRGSPEARSAMDRIRQKIGERGGLNGIRSLARVMRIMDDNGNKQLDRDEMKFGFRDFGVKLTERDLDTVLNVLDRNGDGQVSYDELLRGLRGNLSSRRRSLILKAFHILDKDGSGQVTVEDLATVYDCSFHPEVNAGRMTEEEALGEFLSQWDTLEKDGIVTREEFLDYYKDISASIDSDDYFELMMRNSWKIPGGEGEAAFTAYDTRDPPKGVETDASKYFAAGGASLSELEKEG